MIHVHLPSGSASTVPAPAALRRSPPLHASPRLSTVSTLPTLPIQCNQTLEAARDSTTYLVVGLGGWPAGQWWASGGKWWALSPPSHPRPLSPRVLEPSSRCLPTRLPPPPLFLPSPAQHYFTLLPVPYSPSHNNTHRNLLRIKQPARNPISVLAAVSIKTQGLA